MADTQSLVYAQAYGANIMQLAQQKYAKLMPIVYIKPNVKQRSFFKTRLANGQCPRRVYETSKPPTTIQTWVAEGGQWLITTTIVCSTVVMNFVCSQIHVPLIPSRPRSLLADRSILSSPIRS